MMNMTDDATSEVELRLGEEEAIGAAANTCGPGSKNTECRRHCKWTGKTCINARRHSANSCGARSRSRNSGECARSWESRSLRLGRRRPRGEWSAHPSLGIVVEFPHSVSPRQQEDTRLSCQWLDPKRPTVSIIPAKRSNCVESSLTESASSPFQAEPTHRQVPDSINREDGHAGSANGRR
jgi:hypothetical protein